MSKQLKVIRANYSESKLFHVLPKLVRAQYSKCMSHGIGLLGFAQEHAARSLHALVLFLAVVWAASLSYQAAAATQPKHKGTLLKHETSP